MKGQQNLIPLVQIDDVIKVQEMLQHGSDPNEIDAKGWTPLHWAAQDASPDMIRCLVTAGANIDASDKLGFTPLAVAVGEDRSAIARELLDSGALPNIKNPADGNSTVLHLACSWEQFEVVRILLDTPSVEINVRDNNGKTPLTYALETGNIELASCLRAHGASE
jgi:ankyrin repeat protein